MPLDSHSPYMYAGFIFHARFLQKNGNQSLLQWIIENLPNITQADGAVETIENRWNGRVKCELLAAKWITRVTTYLTALKRAL